MTIHTRLLYILLFISPFILGQSKLNAQSMPSITLEGIVRDSHGEILPGVNILIVETKTGTQTDAEGQYRLRVKLGQRLRFSFIGMKPQEVIVRQSPLNITLKTDEKALEEIVVTGYQKIRNRVYTGAASAVKLEDIKLEGVSDISRMLEGRVAGLSIQNISGSFGSAPRINIRGGASIIGGVQPLWVIDGVIYEDLIPLTLDQLASGDASTLISSAVAGLNPSDIADIQVFKDASATALYGARALNGVIIITTKSAKRRSSLSVSYMGEYSVRLRPSYREFDLLNSQQTMGVYQEMEQKGYLGIESSLYGRRAGVYHQLYKGISSFDPQTGQALIPNTPEAKLAFLRSREYSSTDWFKHLFTYNPISSHTLSLSSGGERLATFASIGYYHDGGWSIADRVNRLTANIKTNFYLNDKITATLSAQGNIRKQHAPGTLPQRKNVAIGGYERDFDINPFAYALSTSRTLRPYNERGEREYYRNNWASFNILNEYDNNYLNIGVLDLKLQAELEYKISKQLELKGLLSVRGASTSTEHEIHEKSNLIQAHRANETPLVSAENIYLLRNQDKPHLQPSVVLGKGGIFHKNETKLHSSLARISADYTLSKDRHEWKAFAFAELRQSKRSLNTFSGYGIQYDHGNQTIVSPHIFDKLFAQGEPYFGLRRYTDRGVTFSTSGTYAYNNRYVVNTVINYEGSNASGRSSRAKWLPTWNIGFKWNIDQEAFLAKSQKLSQLALRASWGLTAKMNSQAINSSVVYKNVLINRYNPNDREHALRLEQLENRDLTWEKMYELNLGIDAAWFKNRIRLNLDLYQRNSFDLIDLVRTSGIGGQYYKYINFGDMRTRGLEIALQTQNIVAKEFSWHSTLTLSLMHQRITRLRNTPNAFDMVSGRGRGNVVGYPRGSLFSYNFQGLTEQGLPRFDFGYYPLPKHRYASSSGADFLDTQYVSSYLIYHGPTEPTIIGGLSNTLRYKGWELAFFITMQAGNKIRLNPSYDPSYADLNVFSKEYNNRWLNPGDEWRTDVPTIPSVDLIKTVGREQIERAYSTYNYSQVRVADGSFVRMKNISLAYHIPKSWAKALFLKSMVLKLNATNPFLIYADSKLRGQDPEFYRIGGVSLPTPRQYTLTLNVGL